MAVPPFAFDDLPTLRHRLAGGGGDGGPTLVALDFDGTLTEIADDPDAPGLTDERRRALARIPSPDRWLAIVSGRALDDVRRRIAVPEAIVIGNHGIEIDGAGLHLEPPPEVAERLRAVLGEVARETQGGDGERRAWIEDKRWTASVHTRPRGDREHHDRVGRAIEPLVRGAGFDLRPGKATWEVRPAGARDKGAAVLTLIESLPGASVARTLYVGDDATDEDAFRALAGGVTVRVGGAGAEVPEAVASGAGETAARYRVAAPAEVYYLLAALFPPERP